MQQNQQTQLCHTTLFIYLFPEFRMQHYNSKKKQRTKYAYMDIKDECVATYIAPIKQKMHLINTMSVHGIICRQVGDTRINCTSILSFTQHSRHCITWQYHIYEMNASYAPVTNHSHLTCSDVLWHGPRLVLVSDRSFSVTGRSIINTPYTSVEGMFVW